MGAKRREGIVWVFVNWGFMGRPSGIWLSKLDGCILGFWTGVVKGKMEEFLRVVQGGADDTTIDFMLVAQADFHHILLILDTPRERI
jgi:hypothetical protein